MCYQNVLAFCGKHETKKMIYNSFSGRIIKCMKQLKLNRLSDSLYIDVTVRTTNDSLREGRGVNYFPGSQLKCFTWLFEHYSQTSRLNLNSNKLNY